jgi:hypothetical protein
MGDPPADEDHVLKVVSQNCQRRQELRVGVQDDVH